MNKTEPSGPITGKITASPNPICFGERCVISWNTNDPAGVEVRVCIGSDDEKRVAQGERSGHVEIPWITNSTVYEFRLYAASRPDVPLDSVKARRSIESAPAVLRELADEVTRGNIDVMELSQFIATVLPRCTRSEKFREIFSLWERRGFHVTPVHFYQPIPETQTLPETLWNRPSDLVGIDMNEAMQLDLLRNHFPKFRGEYNNLAVEPPPGQKRPFHGVDALAAYCMVRHFQPRLIIEVGSGFSSLVLGQAAAKNKNTRLICIDPFPGELLRGDNSVPALQSLTESKVQNVDVEFFSQLGSGDILFIDSSHTVKIGGDVNYLFLEVLPRLNPGVIVHVHDIFFPFEYRRDWVLDEFRFWTEQYLLQAFLTFNSEFEVLLASYYLSHYHEEDLRAAFPNLPRWVGGSFWMRRKAIVGLKSEQTQNDTAAHS
ncbi:MAG TPA: class I SAM-dependent methyltransferase [Candidatus Udaeobacter sp.]